MKTLAIEKIKEREEFLLRRTKHRFEQHRNNKISTEELGEYYRNYKENFKGYIDAFWHMELITDEEKRKIYEAFIDEMIKL